MPRGAGPLPSYEERKGPAKIPLVCPYQTRLLRSHL